LEARVDDLDDDVLVGETNHKAIFGCITGRAALATSVPRSERPLTTCFLLAILAACARNLTRKSLYDPKNNANQYTIGLPLSPATVLYLKAGEVCVRLDLLDERHLEQSQ
jgi:hypothetical protein